MRRLRENNAALLREVQDSMIATAAEHPGVTVIRGEFSSARARELIAARRDILREIRTSMEEKAANVAEEIRN